MQNTRKTELNLVVGINGTGKTTFIRDEIIPSFKKCLVVTPDSAEWKHLPIIAPDQIRTFSGHGRIIYEGKETLRHIKQNYFGGALILDDAMAYLDEQTPDVLQYIYIRRRQYGIDLYIVAHGLRQLPPKCFTFGSYLILFNTTENFTQRKKELLPAIYNKIIAAQESIEKEVLKGKPYHKEFILLDQQIRGAYEASRKAKR
ncbi:ATP-binding protein [Bacteroidales bacterium OttesenSCG-928-C03]|nr:ATP-binding protein [Bacteroidales bacterium OttesenSCG-928-C03]MDL2326739.1 ATP-binding protein [Bacteroidales bacterium OttesenSCG-928-A14]